jgi:PAS domain S-box-containing protein
MDSGRDPPTTHNRDSAPERGWHFLSNHGLVLLAAVREPDATVRELAQAVGVTERTAFRVLSDLETADYMRRDGGGGRGGRFVVGEDLPLRHPLTSSTPLRQLIDLLETADIATWRWTPGSKEIELSEGAWRLHGLVPGSEAVSLETVIGEAIHPTDRGRTREALQRAASTGTIDITYRLLGETPRWIRARGEWQSHNGRLLGSFVDVTREVQLEAARVSSEARLQVIFAESETPMFVFGPGVRVDAVNESFSRTLDRSSSEVLGRRLEELLDSSDIATVRELTDQLTDGDHVTIPEVTLLGKRRRLVRCSISLWADRDMDLGGAGVGVVHLT